MTLHECYECAEEVILASGSPRRRELMTLFGLPFRVVVVNVDESSTPAESPADLARRLSRDKARAVAQTTERGIIIAADTIVVLDDVILGKPASAREAREMLAALRGRPHQVLSAITIIRRPDNGELTDCADATVTMREYSDDEMAAYIASGDPLDKAGGYAIQHHGFHPAANLEGCYASVMGFPLCHVYRALRQIGLTRAQSPVVRCQEVTSRLCPYYRQVLSCTDGPPKA